MTTFIKATQNGDGTVTMTSADFEALITDLDRLKRLQPISNPNNRTKLAAEELTLRDYFAAEAMRLVFSNENWSGRANEAYEMADEMMKAREGK
jgi:hypothetical protein